MHQYGRVCFSLALLVLSACRSEEDRQREDKDRARSWMATVELTATSWAGNRVPARFAHHTFSEASSQLEKLGQPRAASIARSLDEAVRRHDVTTLARLVGHLSAEQQLLDAP